MAEKVKRYIIDPLPLFPWRWAAYDSDGTLYFYVQRPKRRHYAWFMYPDDEASTAISPKEFEDVVEFVKDNWNKIIYQVSLRPVDTGHGNHVKLVLTEVKVKETDNAEYRI